MDQSSFLGRFNLQPTDNTSIAFMRGRLEALRALENDLSFQRAQLNYPSTLIAAALASGHSHSPNSLLYQQTPSRLITQGQIQRSPSSEASSGASHDKPELNKATYFDASDLADPPQSEISNRKSRGGVKEPFPEKLHRMLQEAEQMGKLDVVGFFPHGRAFGIFKPDRFMDEVMPLYFKQSRLSSFQRQLNLYGFTRINSGPDTGGYYHELFLKGRPLLCVNMRRVTIKSAAGVGHSNSPECSQQHHPNFYSMKPINVKEGDCNDAFRSQNLVPGCSSFSNPALNSAVASMLLNNANSVGIGSHLFRGYNSVNHLSQLHTHENSTRYYQDLLDSMALLAAKRENQAAAELAAWVHLARMR